MMAAMIPVHAAMSPNALINATAPIFQLDLFINDPNKGWQPSGFPEYLQHSAANYTNCAGISFIQPADLMNTSYDLPSQVANAVRLLRQQGVAVQLLLGGELSRGWGQLEANPEQAAAKAVALMTRHDCGIEIDNEAGGDATGLIKFIELCDAGKPSGVHLSMDVAGTPNGIQKAVIASAIDRLDWVNLMVSAPAYDQGLSVGYGHTDGVPYNKLMVAYYAGTWVDNCNSIGSGSGSIGAGIKLFDQYGLKGLSIWAVGGASYSGCSTTDAKGFSAALTRLREPRPPPGPGPGPGPPSPKKCHSISPTAKDSWCQQNCNHNPVNCPASLCVCVPGLVEK